MKFEHTSVLLEETIDGLNIKPDGIYVDGTVGAGGHSKEILKRLTSGKLICIDQDKTRKIAMTTRAKITLSSLYETGGSPCGCVCKWVASQNRLLRAFFAIYRQL